MPEEAKLLKQCDLSLPNRCLLRCRMCNIWQLNVLPGTPGLLKLDDYKKFLYEVKSLVHSPFVVSFGGGEPLLDQNIFEIIRICKELGFKTYFPTNAFLIDEAMAERIHSAGVSSLGISIDSLDSHLHDYLRGQVGCWEKAMRAIELLNKYAPDTSINILTVIMRHNLGEIVELAKWVNSSDKLNGIVFQAIHRPANASCGDNWQEQAEYYDLWPRDISLVNKVTDELISLRKNGQRGAKICNPAAQLETFRQYFNNLSGLKRKYSCHLGSGSLRIDPWGNVILCGEMDNAGNIRESSIRELWHSSETGRLRNSIFNCDRACYQFVNYFYDGESQ